MTNATEEDGVTTLKFYRRRNTMDQQNDVVVQVRHGRETRIVTFTVFSLKPEDSIYYNKAQINKSGCTLRWIQQRKAE